MVFSKLKLKSEFTKNVLTLMTGTTIAQAIPIAISPILTRMYSPEDFGEIAGYSAVIAIIGVMATGRYDSAVILPKRDEDAVAVAGASISLSLIFALLTFTLYLFFGDSIVAYVGLQDVSDIWLFLLPLIVFVMGSYQTLIKINIRQKKFGVLAQSQVARQVGSSSVKIAAGALQWTSGGLFLGAVVGHLIYLFVLMKGSFYFFVTNIRGLRKDVIIANAKVYKKFPLISSWSGLLNTASVQLPIILFTTLFSPAIAGYFALSSRIVRLPMSVIGANVAQVYMEKAAAYRNSKDELRRITLEMYKKVLLISVAGLSIITFYGDILFPFVFGDAWIKAGLYSQWISLWLIFNFAKQPLATLYSVLERQGEGLLWNIVIFILRNGVIYLSFLLVFDDVTVVMFLSLIGMIIEFVWSIRLLRMTGVSISKGVLTTVIYAVPLFLLHGAIAIVIRNFFGYTLF